MTSTTYSLRTVLPEDEDFLFEVYCSSRSEEMKLVRWDESQKQAFLRMQFAAQRSDYSQRYPEAVHQVILWEEQRVGRLLAAREKGGIRIHDLTLIPGRCPAEIESMVLRDLQGEARKTGGSVESYVEVFNPSLRIYEQLGFIRAAETGIHLLMEWSPSPEKK